MKTGFFRKCVLGIASIAVVMSMAGVGVAGDQVFDSKHPSDPNDIIYGGRGVSGHSVVAGVCSLILPGLGQLINENQGKKVAVHFVIGLLPLVIYVHPMGGIFFLFHIWSGWDGLIDRRGGYINGTVSVPSGFEEASNSGGFWQVQSGAFGSGGFMGSPSRS